jgi:hypothetical protein
MGVLYLHIMNYIACLLKIHVMWEQYVNISMRSSATEAGAPMRLHCPNSKECHYRKVMKAAPDFSLKGDHSILEANRLSAESGVDDPRNLHGPKVKHALVGNQISFPPEWNGLP